MNDASNYRPKEQVLVDLAKALGFSAAALESNRQGRLTSEQVRQFGARVIQPVIVALFLALGPLLFWSYMVASHEQLSFSNGVSIFVNRLLHLNDLVEANGKFGTFLRMATTLGGLIVAGFTAYRVPWALYFDLLGREVVRKEGRVNAREEQTLRSNGRDPIELFFFTVGFDKFQVGLPAYRALEDGAMYILYVLPRSNVLVSMEPKMGPSATAADPPASTAQADSEPATSGPAEPSDEVNSPTHV